VHLWVSLRGLAIQASTPLLAICYIEDMIVKQKQNEDFEKILNLEIRRATFRLIPAPVRCSTSFEPREPTAETNLQFARYVHPSGTLYSRRWHGWVGTKLGTIRIRLFLKLSHNDT
jgi:hypothetical protein